MMRPVKGFERPLLQWTFIGLSVVLIAIVAVQGVALHREKGRREALQVADLDGRLDRQALEMRLAREQSAREALSLEVARLRGKAESEGQPPPTLTLTPITAPSATPPDPSVERPAADRLIALRLVLPPAVDADRRFAVSIRRWSGGPVLWLRGNLPVVSSEGQRMVIAPISGDVFEPDAYEVTLSADSAPGQPQEPIASYQTAVR
jgi:hypothetical protein